MINLILTAIKRNDKPEVLRLLKQIPVEDWSVLLSEMNDIIHMLAGSNDVDSLRYLYQATAQKELFGRHSFKMSLFTTALQSNATDVVDFLLKEELAAFSFEETQAVYRKEQHFAIKDPTCLIAKESPLMVAVAQGNITLLEQGLTYFDKAEIEKRDRDLQLIYLLDVAILNKQQDIIPLLSQRLPSATLTQRSEQLFFGSSTFGLNLECAMVDYLEENFSQPYDIIKLIYPDTDYNIAFQKALFVEGLKASCINVATGCLSAMKQQINPDQLKEFISELVTSSHFENANIVSWAARKSCGRSYFEWVLYLFREELNKDSLLLAPVMRKLIERKDILRIGILLSRLQPAASNRLLCHSFNDGTTLLHLAVDANDVKCLQVLKVYGGSYAILNGNKLTVKQYAEKRLTQAKKYSLEHAKTQAIVEKMEDRGWLASAFKHKMLCDCLVTMFYQQEKPNDKTFELIQLAAKDSSSTGDQCFHQLHKIFLLASWFGYDSHVEKIFDYLSAEYNAEMKGNKELKDTFETYTQLHETALLLSHSPYKTASLHAHLSDMATNNVYHPLNRAQHVLTGLAHCMIYSLNIAIPEETKKRLHDSAFSKQNRLLYHYDSPVSLLVSTGLTEITDAQIGMLLELLRTLDETDSALLAFAKNNKTNINEKYRKFYLLSYVNLKLLHAWWKSFEEILIPAGLAKYSHRWTDAIEIKNIFLRLLVESAYVIKNELDNQEVLILDEMLASQKEAAMFFEQSKEIKESVVKFNMVQDFSKQIDPAILLAAKQNDKSMLTKLLAVLDDKVLVLVDNQIEFAQYILAMCIVYDQIDAFHHIINRAKSAGGKIDFRSLFWLAIEYNRRNFVESLVQDHHVYFDTLYHRQAYEGNYIEDLTSVNVTLLDARSQFPYAYAVSGGQVAMFNTIMKFMPHALVRWDSLFLRAIKSRQYKLLPMIVEHMDEVAISSQLDLLAEHYDYRLSDLAPISILMSLEKVDPIKLGKPMFFRGLRSIVLHIFKKLETNEQKIEFVDVLFSLAAGQFKSTIEKTVNGEIKDVVPDLIAESYIIRMLAKEMAEIYEAYPAQILFKAINYFVEANHSSGLMDLLMPLPQSAIIKAVNGSKLLNKTNMAGKTLKYFFDNDIEKAKSPDHSLNKFLILLYKLMQEKELSDKESDNFGQLFSKINLSGPICSSFATEALMWRVKYNHKNINFELIRKLVSIADPRVSFLGNDYKELLTLFKGGQDINMGFAEQQLECASIITTKMALVLFATLDFVLPVQYNDYNLIRLSESISSGIQHIILSLTPLLSTTDFDLEDNNFKRLLEEVASYKVPEKVAFKPYIDKSKLVPLEVKKAVELTSYNNALFNLFVDMEKQIQGAEQVANGERLYHFYVSTSKVVYALKRSMECLVELNPSAGDFSAMDEFLYNADVCCHDYSAKHFKEDKIKILDKPQKKSKKNKKEYKLLQQPTIAKEAPRTAPSFAVRMTPQELIELLPQMTTTITTSDSDFNKKISADDAIPKQNIVKQPKKVNQQTILSVTDFPAVKTDVQAKKESAKKSVKFFQVTEPEKVPTVTAKIVLETVSSATPPVQKAPSIKLIPSVSRLAAPFDVIPDDIVDILRWFSMSQYNYFNAYLVGGAVRDCLLGRPLTGDFDITLTIPKNFIYDILARKFGAENVVKKGKNDKHTWTVTYNGRKIDFSAEEDARRDFTCNAIYWHPDVVDMRPGMGYARPGNTIYDPYGGLLHLVQGILQIIGDPDVVYKNKFLVIRAIYFSKKLGFTFSPELEDAIVKYKDEIEAIPLQVENFAEHCEKMFAAYGEDKLEEACQKLRHCGLFSGMQAKKIIPMQQEISELRSSVTVTSS